MLLQQKVIAIRSDLDIVIARSMAREIARSLGFGLADQARIAAGVSELARCIYGDTKSGRIATRQVERDGRIGIEVELTDHSIASSKIDSTTPDLPAEDTMFQDARRLMDEFEMQSRVGAGVTVICRKWRTE